MPCTEATRVHDLLSLLDRTERLLISFYYVERLTPAEIAQVLELAPETVLTKLCEIRSRVRQALQGKSAHAPDSESVAARSASNLRAASSPV